VHHASLFCTPGWRTHAVDLPTADAMILAQREMLTIARSEVTVSRLELERLRLMLAMARRSELDRCVDQYPWPRPIDPHMARVPVWV
jgi:hypothetical protein